MSTLSKRLTAAMAGGIAFMLAAPIVASAAPVHHAAAPVTAGPVEILASETGAFYHVRNRYYDDPSRGTVQVSVRLESRTDSDGKIYYRTTARVAKVKLAVRVEINELSIGSYGYAPDFSSTDTTVLNSGASPSITKSSPWFDSSQSEKGTALSGVAAAVNFSVRWSDGTLLESYSGINNSPTTEPGREDTGPTDSVGSVVLNHYSDAARGSVKIDAGVRLYRNKNLPQNGIVAVQPYATITKRNSAVARVQIDGLYLERGFTSSDFAATGWPFNVASRSSGTGPSASLSTAITSVVPHTQDYSRPYFFVVVFYSVRWMDGTLTTSSIATPLSENSVIFPVGQGF